MLFRSILGEEQGFTAGAEGATRWILDPIDGTHGFARALPVWATLIACERDGEQQDTKRAALAEDFGFHAPTDRELGTAVRSRGKL